MPIKPHISPKILLSISSLYNDTNRIFMEYIDNSIDSADQNYFNLELNRYNRPIEISLIIKGNNYKDGIVTIKDNCFGITNFSKVVKSIGWSDKTQQSKAQGFINGQFGYGIYSFMASCGVMEITSKEENEQALYLPIDRDKFEQEKIEDVSFPDPKIMNEFSSKSGTKVVLSRFDKDMWKLIDINLLRDEVEKHFELILHRENLTIKIIDQTNIEYVCKPYDYDTMEGEVYEDYINDLLAKKGNKNQAQLFPLSNPIHIFLKMTKGMTINNPPIFISKGRRICEIKDIKSFKSKHKGDIWGHPNVTGYIDLKDLLGPTIARNDFRNNKESRALYATLIELEDVIFDFVKRTNQQSEERHYQQLEDVLNKVLSKLAKMDAMSYRTEYLPGGKTDLAGGAFGISIGDEFGDKDRGDGDKIENPSDDVNDTEDNAGLSEDEGKIPSDNDGGENPKNEEKKDESEFAGEPRKRSGFNIKISEEEPQNDNYG